MAMWQNAVTERRFPPPRSVEELDTCFVVRDLGLRPIRANSWHQNTRLIDPVFKSCAYCGGHGPCWRTSAASQIGYKKETELEELAICHRSAEIIGASNSETTHCLRSRDLLPPPLTVLWPRQTMLLGLRDYRIELVGICGARTGR
jgi:hypothetical protein